MIRVLVTGAWGQVGWEVVRSLQPLGDVVGFGRQDLDLENFAALRSTVRSHRPDVIVNAAAYTAVDAAETDEARAQVINGDAVAVLAESAAELGAILVHFSTDYVFAGDKLGDYTEEDEPNPLCAYGRTKLLGEKALRSSEADWICLRTSWVYGKRGANFLRTILRLALEQEEIAVVSDQVGAPTSARLVGETTGHVVAVALRERREQRFRPGVVHVSAAGSTSWYGFAQAIVQFARQGSLRDRLAVKSIQPVATSTHPGRTRRPSNSRLSCRLLEGRFGLSMPPWELGLALCMDEFSGTSLLP